MFSNDIEKGISIDKIESVIELSEVGLFLKRIKKFKRILNVKTV